MVGVGDPILRCHLLQCQQREKVTPTVSKGRLRHPSSLQVCAVYVYTHTHTHTHTHYYRIPCFDEVETLGHVMVLMTRMARWMIWCNRTA